MKKFIVLANVLYILVFVFQTALKRRGSREVFKDKKSTSQVHIYALFLILRQYDKMFSHEHQKNAINLLLLSKEADWLMPLTPIF